MPEPVEGFETVGQHRIHYAKWGRKGNAIVILHSMGVDDHSMDLLCEALAERYRILALTNLAHGQSSVPEENVTLPEHSEILRECYRRLGFTPCVLIGHSIGGRMGMILAAEHPEEVRGMVLVDIAPPDPVARSWSSTTPESFRNRKEAEDWLKQRYPGFDPRYIENRLRYGFIEQRDGSLKPRPTGSPTMVSYSTDLWPYLGKIKIPTKLVLGGNSQLVTPEKLERMSILVRGLDVAKVEGASHMVPQDKPDEFQKEVESFLKKLGW